MKKKAAAIKAPEKKSAKKGKSTTSVKPAWRGVADKMLGKDC